MFENLFWTQEGADVTTKQLGELRDVEAQRLDENLERWSWELLLAETIDKLEVRKGITLERHHLVVEQAKEVDNLIVIVLVDQGIGTVPRSVGGSLELVEGAQKCIGALKERVALQDPAKDACSAVNMGDLVRGGDGGIESFPLSNDGLGPELEVGSGHKLCLGVMRTIHGAPCLDRSEVLREKQ